MHLNRAERHRLDIFSFRLACETDVIFLAYFRQAEAKGRRARSPSRERGEERQKINASTQTIV